MHLSKRLKKIADFVDDNSHIYDIGCDHALLDVYLSINKNVTSIATDVTDYSINKALENIEKYHLEDKIKVIKTDGLTEIAPKQIDTVILSGMGTKNILKILINSKASLPDNIIIQSNNDTELLRIKVTELGYMIDKEDIVYEKSKYYIIIKFVKGNKHYSKKDYQYGPYLRKNNPEYLSMLVENQMKIIDKIPKYHIMKIFQNIYKLNQLKKELR